MNAAEVKTESVTTDAEQPAVRIRGLSKTFRTGSMLRRRQVHALRSVDLDIAPGEIVALVGESGSGKSTLARCVARLENPDEGSLEVAGENVLQTQPRSANRAYRQRVQMVFQDPFGSLNPAHRVEHILTRSLSMKSGTLGKVQPQLKELVRSVGLEPQVLSAFPHELSGGQRQRIAIARVLAVEPEVIVADEPTSMLDVSVRIGVLNLLASLREERGISMLYVTHDLASARYLSDRTMVMHRGSLVEGGETESLLANPQHPYTQLLISAVPDPRRQHRFDPQTRQTLRRTVEQWSDATEYERRSVAADHGTDHWILTPKGTS